MIYIENIAHIPSKGKWGHESSWVGFPDPDY
jgi:hypothetical protein